MKDDIKRKIWREKQKCDKLLRMLEIVRLSSIHIIDKIQNFSWFLDLIRLKPGIVNLKWGLYYWMKICSTPLSFAQKNRNYIVYCCICLHGCCFGLETRVISKISTHPCNPRNFDWFSKTGKNCTFCVLTLLLSLCQTTSRPYKMSRINALCINQFY